MMKRLLQTLIRRLPSRREEMLATVAPPPRADRDAVARAYARLFDTDDGRLVMAHLQGQTLLRAVTPETPDSHIRFIEGQRALMHTILRFVAVGKGQ